MEEKFNSIHDIRDWRVSLFSSLSFSSYLSLSLSVFLVVRKCAFTCTSMARRTCEARDFRRAFPTTWRPDIRHLQRTCQHVCYAGRTRRLTAKLLLRASLTPLRAPKLECARQLSIVNRSSSVVMAISTWFDTACKIARSLGKHTSPKMNG